MTALRKLLWNDGAVLLDSLAEETDQTSMLEGFASELNEDGGRRRPGFYRLFLTVSAIIFS